MSLPCPQCGAESLLVTQTVMLVPVDVPGFEGELWGRPPLFPDSPTFCNRNNCRWHGKLREAREARRP